MTEVNSDRPQTLEKKLRRNSTCEICDKTMRKKSLGKHRRQVHNIYVSKTILKKVSSSKMIIINVSTRKMTATDVTTTTSTALSGKSGSNSKEASPVKVKTPTEVMEEATTFLATSKRRMSVSDVPAAVTSLAQACELLSAQFGRTAVECAESYFHYGKALLELSRLESGVYGNALEGVPEEGEDVNISQDFLDFLLDEKSEVEMKVGEALKENFQFFVKKKDGDKVEKEVENSGDNEGETDGTEDKGMEKGDDSQEGEGDESQVEDMESDDSTTEEATEAERESGEKKDEEEKPSNLQLAWEMLELAKVVITKQVESGVGVKAEFWRNLGTAGGWQSKPEKRLCSTMLALGEVSILNENYSQAVEDIKLCLKKQEILPQDSRIVAETLYQLGQAQGFATLFDDAVESLNCAVKIITERIKNLKAKSPKKSPRKDEKKEVTELEARISEIEEKIALLLSQQRTALIPEIEEKIADTKDMKKEAKNKIEGILGMKSSSGPSSGDAKRKVEDDGDNKENLRPTKRPLQTKMPLQDKEAVKIYNQAVRIYNLPH